MNEEETSSKKVCGYEYVCVIPCACVRVCVCISERTQKPVWRKVCWRGEELYK